VSLGKPGVYAAVTGSIRLESLFLTLEGSGFELVVCVKFSKLVVGAGTGSFQVNSNIPLFDRLAEFSVYSNLNRPSSKSSISRWLTEAVLDSLLTDHRSRVRAQRHCVAVIMVLAVLRGRGVGHHSP
jgi:hypothetical protein